MSAGDEIIAPLVSWQGAAALLSAVGLGGVLTALIQRPSRRSVEAAASRDEATGEAAVIGALATAFTGTTGALREEIDRMQDMLNELRDRVVEAEAELRAAAGREAVLERLLAEKTAQLEVSHADVLRLRGERDVAVERTVQQEGEIRQLNAVLSAKERIQET